MWKRNCVFNAQNQHTLIEKIDNVIDDKNWTVYSITIASNL